MMQKPLIIKSILTTILTVLLGSFSTIVASTPIVLKDSVDLTPLPIADRLLTLRDESILIAPNPYYHSSLAIALPVLLVNRDVPTSSPYISYRKKDVDTFSLVKNEYKYKVHPEAVNAFLTGLSIDEMNILRLQMEAPTLLRQVRSDLLAHKLVEEKVAPNGASLDNIEIVITKNSTDLAGKEVKRKYWKFGLESVIQFSQNYISHNWHQGGGSNLNLYNKQLLRYDYKRDRVSWNNELEWKLSVYTSAADTVSKYRVAEDLLRFRSNIGLQAWGNFFYSLEGEVKTSLFTRREENKTEILSALFSPVVLNVGLGIKYELDKKYDAPYGRRLRISANLSPLSYDFRYSYHTKGIDLKRHGFAEGKNVYSAFGSTFRIESIFDYSQTISWRSRFLYNTSYKRIESEWENSLNFAFTQYFSTQFNVVLRFDDAVPLTPENNNPLQINEIFSLGFRYLI